MVNKHAQIPHLSCPDTVLNSCPIIDPVSLPLSVQVVDIFLAVDLLPDSGFVQGSDLLFPSFPSSPLGPPVSYIIHTTEYFSPVLGYPAIWEVHSLPMCVYIMSFLSEASRMKPNFFVREGVTGCFLYPYPGLCMLACEFLDQTS